MADNYTEERIKQIIENKNKKINSLLEIVEMQSKKVQDLSSKVDYFIEQNNKRINEISENSKTDNTVNNLEEEPENTITYTYEEELFESVETNPEKEDTFEFQDDCNFDNLPDIPLNSTNIIIPPVIEISNTNLEEPEVENEGSPEISPEESNPGEEDYQKAAGNGDTNTEDNLIAEPESKKIPLVMLNLNNTLEPNNSDANESSKIQLKQETPKFSTINKTIDGSLEKQVSPNIEKPISDNLSNDEELDFSANTQEVIHLDEKGTKRRSSKRHPWLMAIGSGLIIILMLIASKYILPLSGEYYPIIAPYQYYILIGGGALSLISAILVKVIGTNIIQKIFKYIGFAGIYVSLFVIINCNYGGLALIGMPPEILDGNYHYSALPEITNLPILHNFYSFLVNFKNGIDLPDISSGFVQCISATNDMWFSGFHNIIKIILSLLVWFVAVLFVLFIFLICFAFPVIVPVIGVILIREILNLIFKARM